MSPSAGGIPALQGCPAGIWGEGALLGLATQCGQKRPSFLERGVREGDRSPSSTHSRAWQSACKLPNLPRGCSSARAPAVWPSVPGGWATVPHFAGTNLLHH